MANGMPDWEEWKGLTEDQRQYSLFKVLSDLYHRDCDREQICEKRLETCVREFKTVKDDPDTLDKAFQNRKKVDSGIAGAFGFAGGAGVWVLKWIVGGK